MKINLSIQKTTYLKGLAILLILLSHTKIIKYGGLIGVGLFLTLSGYGMYESYTKNGLNNYFKKRISKVLIPYWIFNILWIIIDYIKGTTYSLKTIIFSFLTYKNIIDITMWYISYLLVWYILFYLIFKFKNKYIQFISFILSMPISLFLSVKGIFGIGGGAHFYVLMFPLGIVLCYIFKNYKNLLEKYLTPILSASIFIFLFIYNNSFNITLSYIETVLMLLSIVLILTLGISLLNESNKHSIIMIYGKYSYFIYLIEGVLLNKYNFLKQIISNNYLYTFVFVILTLILAIPLNKLYDKLFNKKQKKS